MEREYDPAAHEDQTPWKKKKKNKRRFSDEQIRSLESIFESETRLEPRKKLQVARELGLQPRQVGIWFQNRRARWKSKQMEKDFRTLRANYDSLASRFESLKNEKQGLILQMQKLSELLAEPHDISKDSKGGVDGSSTGAGGAGGSEQADNKREPEAEVQPSFQQAGLGDGGFHGSQIEKDEYNIIGHAGQQQAGEEEFLSMDHAYRSEFPASSPEKLYGFDSADMFDHSLGKNQEKLKKQLKQKAPEAIESEYLSDHKQELASFKLSVFDSSP